MSSHQSETPSNASQHRMERMSHAFPVMWISSICSISVRQAARDMGHSQSGVITAFFFARRRRRPQSSSPAFHPSLSIGRSSRSQSGRADRRPTSPEVSTSGAWWLSREFAHRNWTSVCPSGAASVNGVHVDLSVWRAYGLSQELPERS